MLVQHSRNAIILKGDGPEGQDAENGEDGVPTDHHGTSGKDASAAEPGADGQDLELRLSTDPNKKLVHIDASGLLQEQYRLSSIPAIKWFSKGGRGGRGGVGGSGAVGQPGARGQDATQATPGTNGQPGGNGGSGGEGTGGADGGCGGHIKIVVKEQDAYLLMLVEPCDEEAAEHALAGGTFGERGCHGEGAVGGVGGKGGRPLTYIDDHKKKVTIDGGYNGQDGAAGLTPTWEVPDGKPGKQGSFQIEVIRESDPESDNNGNKQESTTYTGRYYVEFVECDVEGRSPMSNPNEFEFGDVISVRNIKVENIGKMPTPSNQKILLQIRDNGDPNVNPFYPDACIPSGTEMPPGETALSKGQLQFFAGYPPGEVDDEADFDPLTQMTSFYLQAFQAGPARKRNVSAFQREYRSFHRGEGQRIIFRYPVENSKGLIGVASLCPGEETLITLELANVGLNTLGGFDEQNIEESNRRLGVRYSLNPDEPYDVSPTQVNFSAYLSLEDRASKGRRVNLKGQSTLLDVPELMPGAVGDFTSKFSFDVRVPFYSCTILHVDILVETLPVPAGIEIVEEEDWGGLPSMSVVQRRKLELFCEPKFERQENARVVLVTSFATKKEQYDSLTQKVLDDTMHLVYETFSVSRYGTLDPEFVLEDGSTLKDAFSGKLIIVFAEKYRPNAREDFSMSPVHLLSQGCMEQTSGFDSSTRWLFLGINESFCTDLLNSHLAEIASVTDEFPDIASYEKFIQQAAEGRAAVGRGSKGLPVREDIIHVTVPAGEEKFRKKLHKLADSLAVWLRQIDPLNQYAVVYDETSYEPKKKGLKLKKRSEGTLKVRRGFCRSLNSALVVPGNYSHETKALESEGMLLSIAESMSREMRAQLLCDAVRNELPAKVLTAYKFASVSDLIRDASTFLDCSMKMNEDLELSFPTVGVFLESVDVMSLIQDCKTDDNLHERTVMEFSDLLTRFELVANSKDLRPRFSVSMGRSSRKTTHEAMIDIVDRLRVQWKPISDRDSIEQQKKILKEEIRTFLRADLVGKQVVNVRADQRWMQGLNYMHSTENSSVFEATANPSKRLIELESEGAQDNYKICHPPVKVYSSDEMQAILAIAALRKESTETITSTAQIMRDTMTMIPNQPTRE